MIEHRAPISGISSSRNRYVATAGYDNQVILWDAASGKALARGHHDHLVNQVRFSPCGRLLLSTSSDHTARLWSVPSMKLIAVLAAHDDDVEAAAFHPTDDRIATASRDHTARVFDFTGKMLVAMHGHTQDVISVEWSGDGRQIVTSSDDGTVRRWDAITGAMLESIELGGVETDTIVVTASGHIIAGNDAGDIIRVGSDHVIKAHRAGIKRLVYCRETARLVSLSYDRTARVYRVGDDGGLEPIGSASLPSKIWPRSCAFLDDARLAFATFCSSYATLDLSTGRWDLDRALPTPGINAVAVVEGRRYDVGDAGLLRSESGAGRALGSLCNFLTPLGDTVVTGGQMGAIFDAADGQVIYQHHSPLNCGASFRRGDCDYAIIGAYTGEGIVISKAPGQKPAVEAVVQLHENAVKGVAVAHGRIFSVCATGAASFHDAATYALMEHIADAHDRIANACVSLPDGRFVSVSRDRCLRIWDGTRSSRHVSPLPHSLKCVAASSDGRMVAAGSYGGHVALMDVASMRWILVERPSTYGISALTYDEARRVFVASCYDGRIYEIARPIEAAA